MNSMIFCGMIGEDQKIEDHDSPNRSRRGGTLFSAGTLRARILGCVCFVGEWTVVACGLAQPPASDTQTGYDGPVADITLGGKCRELWYIHHPVADRPSRS
jgi:hypothetical protein